MTEDIEEAMLALRAAGFATPQYEVLPDGSYHIFYGTKENNSLIHNEQSRSENRAD